MTPTLLKAPPAVTAWFATTLYLFEAISLDHPRPLNLQLYFENLIKIV